MLVQFRYRRSAAATRAAGSPRAPATGTAARNVTEARRCEATIRATAIAGIGTAMAGAYSLAEAAVDYAKVSAHRSSRPSMKRCVAELLEYFGPASPQVGLRARPRPRRLPEPRRPLEGRVRQRTASADPRWSRSGCERRRRSGTASSSGTVAANGAPPAPQAVSARREGLQCRSPL